jgi:hypothetical protein
MLPCFEIACHSERSEESRPGLFGAVRLTQSKIPPPRSARGRNDISSFPGARQQTGMSDCSENSVKTPHPHTPFPSSQGEGKGGGELGEG